MEMLSQQIQDANAKTQSLRRGATRVWSGLPNFMPPNPPCGAKILDEDAGGDFDPSGHLAMPENIFIVKP